MSHTLEYIILGVVQGITEWLPVSSSGHLVFFNELFGLEQDLSFAVLLHLASVIVMVVYFRSDILRLLSALFHTEQVEDRSYIAKLVVATMITISVALLLSPYLEALDTTITVAWFLLVTTVLVGATRFAKSSRSLDWGLVVLLGVMQGVAVIPGLSRSGSMIGLAMLLGLAKEKAFTFTFLAGIPAIFGAFLWTMKDLVITADAIYGFIASLIVGFAALWALEMILKKNRFHWFALYTCAIGIAVLFI